jgi:hypothetical protein
MITEFFVSSIFFFFCLALDLANKIFKDKRITIVLPFRDVRRMLLYFHVLGQAKIKALGFWLIFGE